MFAVDDSELDLVADIIVRDRSPDYVAENHDLPVDAVREALDYYYANKEWIDAEVDEQGRRLGLK